MGRQASRVLNCAEMSCAFGARRWKEPITLDEVPPRHVLFAKLLTGCHSAGSPEPYKSDEVGGLALLCWNHDWPAWLWCQWSRTGRKMPAGDGRNGAKGQTLPAITYEWSTPLRVFILYANPVAASFGATLHRQVVATLRSRRHEIDDYDLYLERFNPVMGEQERMRYYNVELNRRRSRPMPIVYWRRRRSS